MWDAQKSGQDPTQEAESERSTASSSPDAARAVPAGEDAQAAWEAFREKCAGNAVEKAFLVSRSRRETPSYPYCDALSVVPTPVSSTVHVPLRYAPSCMQLLVLSCLLRCCESLPFVWQHPPCLNTVVLQRQPCPLLGLLRSPPPSLAPYHVRNNSTWCVRLISCV